LIGCRGDNVSHHNRKKKGKEARVFNAFVSMTKQQREEEKKKKIDAICPSIVFCFYCFGACKSTLSMLIFSNYNFIFFSHLKHKVFHSNKIMNDRRMRE
jgi:hypothetical protein